MMKSTTVFFAFALVAVSVTAQSANAAQTSRYTPQAFEAAQKAGQPILVEITAPWCPTCKAQKPILGKLEADQKFDNLRVFDVDFDTQKDVVRRFGASMQSTLIAFKGRQEVARSVGDTQAGSIAGLLDKSI